MIIIVINIWTFPLVRFLKCTSEERTQMDQRTRNLINIHKALHPSDDGDRLYVSRKKGGGGLARIEDCVDVSLQGLEKCMKKSWERLIIAANNRTENIWTKKTTQNKKQKLEEKQLNEYFDRNVTRKDLDVTTKVKPSERNWVSSNSNTKQRRKDLLN